MKRFIPLLLLMLTLSSCSSGFSVPKIKEIEPYTEKIENAYRFYDTYIDAFIPSDDYGKVYPYIGEIRTYSHGLVHPAYGLCTADGAIVCDPVYLSAHTLTVGNYTYYMMSSDMNNLGRSDITVIRDDGRVSRKLSDSAGVVENCGYLEYVCWENEKRSYRYLNIDLQDAFPDLSPKKTNTSVSIPPGFHGTCPLCGSDFYSGNSYARLTGYDINYAYYHHNGQSGMVDVFTPSQSLSFSFPLESMPRSLSVTPTLIYGHCRQGKPFLYDRESETFVSLPYEQLVFDAPSDGQLCIRYQSNDDSGYLLYDPTDKTLLEYEQILYVGDCLLSLQNGISRVTRDGDDIFTLRLLVD